MKPTPVPSRSASHSHTLPDAVPASPARLAPLVDLGPELSPREVERFSRHLLLSGFGEDAQRRLRNARVCVLGAGGLGSPAVSYLVAAGVGTLGIVDDDVVTLSNLQRQVLHRTADVGVAKTTSAKRAALALDPDVNVRVHEVRLTAENAAKILGDYDLVLDGTDNFDTRYLVSDVCAELGLPVVWASVLQFDAQVSVFWSAAPGGRGVTLRDLFAAPPPPGSVPSCSQAGVLGAMVGHIGALMGTEAVKLITGIGEVLLGRVLIYDALAATWTQIPLAGSAQDGAPRPAQQPQSLPDAAAPPSQPASPSLKSASSPTLPGAAAAPPSASASPAPPASADLTPEQLHARLAARDAGDDDFLLVDVRDPEEFADGTISGAINVPLASLVTRRGQESLPKDRDLVLFCAVGARSAHGLALLRTGGFTRISHLSAGILTWRLWQTTN